MHLSQCTADQSDTRFHRVWRYVILFPCGRSLWARPVYPSLEAKPSELAPPLLNYAHQLHKVVAQRCSDSPSTAASRTDMLCLTLCLPLSVSRMAHVLQVTLLQSCRV